jgi:transcriptional regulator with XRE-family HTH domain
VGQKEQASNPINQAAVRLIRAGFADSDLTQQQLSDLSGIPRSTLANILSPMADARLVHVGQLVRIAMALGIETAEWARELEAFERKRLGQVGLRRATQVSAPATQKRAARGRSAKPSSDAG